MAHFLGVQVPPHRRVVVGLTQVYGLGQTRAATLCHLLGLPPRHRVRDLTKRQVARLTYLLKTHLEVGPDLRRVKREDVQRLMDLGVYRGLRHRLGLPLRGQRTSTNGRTQRSRASFHRRGG